MNSNATAGNKLSDKEVAGDEDEDEDEEEEEAPMAWDDVFEGVAAPGKSAKSAGKQPATDEPLKAGKRGKLCRSSLLFVILTCCFYSRRR